MSAMIYDKATDTFIVSCATATPKVGEYISIRNKNDSKKPVRYFVREVSHYIDVNAVTTRVYVEKDVKAANKSYIIDEKQLKRIARVVEAADNLLEELFDTGNEELYGSLETQVGKLTKEDLELLGLEE